MIDHWCRHVMNDEVQKKVRSLEYKKMAVLEISGTAWKDFGFKSYESVSYPEFDICKDVLDKTYDIVIAEQVFEHIKDPSSAADNVLSMLKKRGLFIITTPFFIKYHPSPLDLYRWTPDGMKVFLSQHGFGPIESFGWGNKECLVGDFDDWHYYDPNKHSLKNDPEFPIVVWAFAYRGTKNLKEPSDC